MRGGDDTDEFMMREKEAADIIKQNIMSAINDNWKLMMRPGQKKIIVSSKKFLKAWRNELYRETAWDGIFNSTDPDKMAMMVQFRSTYTPEYSRKIKDEDGKLIRVFYNENTEVMDKIEKDLKIEDIMVEAAKEKSKKIFGDYGVSFEIKKKRNMFWTGGKRKTRRKSRKSKKRRTRRRRRKRSRKRRR